MIRALLAMLLLCFGALVGAAALAAWVETRPSGEMVVRLGEREAFLRAGEAAVFELRGGGALYVMRLRRPLAVNQSSEIGGDNVPRD